MFGFCWVPKSQDYRDFRMWQPVGSWVAVMVETAHNDYGHVQIGQAYYDWVRRAPTWVALGRRNLRKLSPRRSGNFCSESNATYGRTIYSLGRYLLSYLRSGPVGETHVIPEIGAAYSEFSALSFDLVRARRMFCADAPDATPGQVIDAIAAAASPARSPKNPMPYPVLPAAVLTSPQGVRMLVERFSGDMTRHPTPLHDGRRYPIPVDRIVSDAGYDRQRLLGELLAPGQSGGSAGLDAAIGRLQHVLGALAKYADVEELLANANGDWLPLVRAALADTPPAASRRTQGQRDTVEFVQTLLRSLAVPFSAALGHPADWADPHGVSEVRVAATSPQHSWERPCWFVAE